MAQKTGRTPTADAEYEQLFPDWVYQVPGFLLILLGFGGVLFVTFA